MESLKMYIKENWALTTFYSVGFIFAIVWIFIRITDFFSGEITRNTIKTMIMIPFLPLTGFYYLLLAKKLILVLKDYKNPCLITETLKIKKAGYAPCEEPRYGAYFEIFFHGDKHNFWLYKKSQIYSEFVAGEEYKVTYYKNSRCIHSIERLTFNVQTADDIAYLNKSKRKKKSKKKVVKKPLNIDPYKTFISNYKDGFVVDIFWIFTIPFYIMLCIHLLPKNLVGLKEQLFMISTPFVILFYFLIIRTVIRRIMSYNYYKKGIVEKTVVIFDTIPSTKKFLVTGKPNEFFLFGVDENKKRRRYRFYSMEILGLGDLTEREGFMGYGNFMGVKYEIEYYKVCHVIKSMRFIEEPGETN